MFPAKKSNTNQFSTLILKENASNMNDKNSQYCYSNNLSQKNVELSEETRFLNQKKLKMIVNNFQTNNFAENTNNQKHHRAKTEINLTRIPEISKNLFPSIDNDGQRNLTQAYTFFDKENISVSNREKYSIFDDQAKIQNLNKKDIFFNKSSLDLRNSLNGLLNNSKSDNDNEAEKNQKLYNFNKNSTYDFYPIKTSNEHGILKTINNSANFSKQDIDCSLYDNYLFINGISGNTSGNDAENFKSYDLVKSFTNSGLTRTKTVNKTKKFDDDGKTLYHYKLDTKEVHRRVQEYKDIMKELYELRDENTQLKTTQEHYENLIEEYQIMITNIQTKHKDEIETLTGSFQKLQSKIQNEYGSLELEIENCVKVMKLDRKLIIDNAVNALKELFQQNNHSMTSEKSFVENVGESFYNNVYEKQIQVNQFNQNTVTEKKLNLNDTENFIEFYKNKNQPRSRKHIVSDYIQNTHISRDPKGERRLSCCGMEEKKLKNGQNLFNRKNTISFTSDIDEDINIQVCEEFYPEDFDNKMKRSPLNQIQTSKTNIESEKMALCRKTSKNHKDFVIAKELQFQGNNNDIVQNFESSENMDYVDKFEAFSNNNKSICNMIELFEDKQGCSENIKEIPLHLDQEKFKDSNQDFFKGFRMTTEVNENTRRTYAEFSVDEFEIDQNTSYNDEGFDIMKRLSILKESSRQKDLVIKQLKECFKIFVTLTKKNLKETLAVTDVSMLFSENPSSLNSTINDIKTKEPSLYDQIKLMLPDRMKKKASRLVDCLETDINNNRIGLKAKVLKNSYQLMKVALDAIPEEIFAPIIQKSIKRTMDDIEGRVIKNTSDLNFVIERSKKLLHYLKNASKYKKSFDPERFSEHNYMKNSKVNSCYRNDIQASNKNDTREFSDSCKNKHMKDSIKVQPLVFKSANLCISDVYKSEKLNTERAFNENLDICKQKHVLNQALGEKDVAMKLQLSNNPVIQKKIILMNPEKKNVDIIENFKFELKMINGVQKQLIDNQTIKYEDSEINTKQRFSCKHNLVGDTCKKSLMNFLQELSIIFVSIAEMRDQIYNSKLMSKYAETDNAEFFRYKREMKLCQDLKRMHLECKKVFKCSQSSSQKSFIYNLNQLCNNDIINHNEFIKSSRDSLENVIDEGVNTHLINQENVIDQFIKDQFTLCKMKGEISEIEKSNR